MELRANLDFGLSRLNFRTISSNAFLGSRNLIIPRRSISRLRKYECTNWRAEGRDRFWYIRAVIARGMDERPSECRTAGRNGV